jgi:hypothetical protein
MEASMSIATQFSDFLPEGRPVNNSDAPSDLRPPRLRIASERPEPNCPQDLLARLLTPPADAKMRDRRFAALRQQLIDQFLPIDAIQLLDADLIASDMLHLASLRQAMERVTVPALGADLSQTARKAEDHKKLTKLVQWLIERGEESKLFDCDDQEAGVLAPRLMEIFRALKDLVAEAEAEMAEALAEWNGTSSNESEEKPPVDSDEDDGRRRQLLEIIMPIQTAVEDRVTVQEVLMGNQPLNPDEQIRWVALLKFAAEDATCSDFGLNSAMVKAEAAEREMLAALAQDPLKLAVLHRCACEIEGAIDRRLQRLKVGK